VKIAVHAHMHYADLMEQVADRLDRIPYPYDLIVTVTDAAAKNPVADVLAAKVKRARARVVVVANKGRDVKPFYCDVASLLDGYEIIGHIHGKKSSFNNGATAGWLEYLLDCMMGSEETVRLILERFRSDAHAGVIYPERFHRLPYWANTWLSNKGWAGRLRDRLYLQSLPETYFSYPVGNMFWARREAIRPLLELGLCEDDFPDERGQNDGEIMHALERMTTVVARDRGYVNYIIRRDGGAITLKDDSDGIDLSAYHGSSLDYLRQGIARPGIAVVSFDIFDTLVVRPLSDPADLFELMQPEVERIKGRPVDFRRVRVAADAWQRERLAAGRDVTFASIYERVADVLQLTEGERDALMALELQLESRYMRPRTAVVEVMKDAYASGKRVILTSDMYLDKEAMVRLLEGLGIVAYHSLYLSAEIGKRKDTRTLFPHILEVEGIRPEEMIHVGDNEHSDLQVAGDLGICTFHVMRPIELFRRTGLGRTGFPGPSSQLSLYARLSFGLMLARVYDDPFPRGGSPVNGDLRTFGYWYFGPILLAFVQWAASRSATEGVDTLYFLSRDGEILVRIYELLQRHSRRSLPAGVYLEVSRRSIGVPFVGRVEQLDKLLQPEYAGGPLSELLRIRLGFELTSHPEVDVRGFGFADIHSTVFIPADLSKVKQLCYFLYRQYPEHFRREKECAVGYLRQMGLYDDGKKAVVDIGYSGTLQRILNEAQPEQPVHGYYMVLYKTFDALMKNPLVNAKGLFGDRIDPYRKELPVDRYSLFYEMVLSSTRGPVERYDETCRPVYAAVSEEEREKLSKLPEIHAGILEYCRDVLGLLEDAALVRWEDTAFLLKPFQWFLEHPSQDDMGMLAGYSMDDHYCGQGVLYWSPPSAADETADFLWKKCVPHAGLWGDGELSVVWGDYGGFSSRREFELFNWYQERYERMPGWFKKLGQLFKILRGTKRIRIVLEDVGYVRNQATKAEEIQAWYNKEYEVLPRWYKKLGEFIRWRHTG
jgi:predicted HAD superfamily hydrolase